jgi:hypothetical protein
MIYVCWWLSSLKMGSRVEDQAAICATYGYMNIVLYDGMGLVARSIYKVAVSR